MTVGRRLVLLVAGAVAAAVVVASVVVYVSVRTTLRAQVDDALRGIPDRVQARLTQRLPDLGEGPRIIVSPPPASFGGPTGYVQVITPEGEVVRSDAGPALPVTPETREVAEGRREGYLSDETVDGVHLRVLTIPGVAGDVFQIARPLTEVDETLDRLLLILLGVGTGGVGLAGGFGLLVARRALRPVQELTETAEHVAATQDLSRRLPADPEGDELDRLGASFNAMMGALEESRAAQRQLVADASHELRTPLTSVLTNVELLARLPDDATAEREAVVAAATAQVHELDDLIEDLVDLARPAPPVDAIEDVALDALVADAVTRARTHAPGCVFDVEAEPALVRGVRPRLFRAVGNLLDNAVKHGPPAGPVRVRVAGNGNGAVEIVVDDAGRGIPLEEREHAFDRFWRSPSARGLPGSGLGLAIVRHVAEAHGGSVAAEDAPGGGARLRVRLPRSPSS